MSRPPLPAPRRRGFTLVELLVVIGIIVMLIALVLPSINRAYKVAVRNRMQAELAMIEGALDAYKIDFGDYPRPDRFVTSPYQGSAAVCWALLAPGPASQDGADGIGFRARPGGRVWGPYLPPDRFRFGVPAGPGSASPFKAATAANGVYDDRLTVIADHLGNTILYFPKKLTSGAVSDANTYIGSHTNKPVPRYISDDNDPVSTFGSLQNLQLQMPGVRPDGTVNTDQVINLPYLLWSAGPDETFGTADDVTNFK